MGNMKGASETLKTAEKLRVSISPDAMKDYLSFVKEDRTRKESGIFSQLSDLFRSKK